jgi:16S rRNA C1402 N4-methylase RsmH
MAIPYVLDAAHWLAGRAVDPGGFAIDATVGNGYDTLFLAQAVGAQGRVVGFDVQEEALDETRRRVQADAPEASLRLVHAGHETMADHLSERDCGTVDAVMFNLGYLPGGDRSITTEPETTCRALDTSVNLLRPGGVVTVVAYTGHDGGAEEARAVESWVAARPDDAFRALSYQLLNQANDPPRLYAVEKREGHASPSAE